MRGTDSHLSPWGDPWGVERCISKECGRGDPISVERYPEAASSYGMLGTAGNSLEWTRSLPRFKYCYNPHDGRENLDAPQDVERVLPGGSFRNDQMLVRCANHSSSLPDDTDYSIGFRVVVRP
jgi:formylglycine-generating enzyme required for sulfatase activity